MVYLSVSALLQSATLKVRKLPFERFLPNHSGYQLYGPEIPESYGTFSTMPPDDLCRLAEAELGKNAHRVVDRQTGLMVALS